MDNQKMNNNRPDQDPEDGNNKKDDMNKKSLLVMVVLAIAVMIIAQMLSGKIASASQKEVTYTEFMQDVKDGKVTKVELDSDRIYYEVKNQKNVKYYTGNVQDERLYEELDKAGVTYSRKVIDTTTYVMSSILSFVLPTVLMVAVMMIFYRFCIQRRRWCDGRRQEQRQALCAGQDRCYIPGCGRSGRIQGISERDCGFSS